MVSYSGSSGLIFAPYVESQPAAPQNVTVLMAMSLERPFRLIEWAPIQHERCDFKREHLSTEEKPYENRK